MTTRNWSFLAILSILWGGSFFFVELALRGLPVSAIALGIGFLGEHLLPRHMIGFGLIVIGLLAIDGRLWKWAKS